MRGRFRPKNTWLVTAALLAGIVLLAGFLFYRFAQTERARALTRVETHSRVLAAARSDAASRWMDQQLEIVRKLSRNEVVPFYLRLLKAQTDRSEDDRRMALDYLRNLLDIAASERAFGGGFPDTQIGVNLGALSQAGLAFVWADGRPIAISRGFDVERLDIRNKPGLSCRVEQEAARQEFEAAGFCTAVVPIEDVKSDDGGRELLGFILGRFELTNDFYATLQRPYDGFFDSTTYLVLPEKKHVRVISPLSPKIPAGALKFARTSTEISAVALTTTSQDFGRFLNYQGEPVFATAAQTGILNWVLVLEIPYLRAVEGVDNRLGALAAGGILLLVLTGGVAGTFSQQWVRKREQQKTSELKETLDLLEQKWRLLAAITEFFPGRLMLLDDEGIIQFSNVAFDEYFGVSPGEAVGKTISDCVGPYHAQFYFRCMEETLAGVTISRFTDHLDDDDETGEVKRVLCRRLTSTDDVPGYVLFVEFDATREVRHQRNQEERFRSLLDLIVSAIDQRGANSAGHSVRVGQLSRHLAGEMELPAPERELAETCGKLVNLYKLFVSADVMAEPRTWTTEEREEVKNRQAFAVEVLQNIESFEPLMEILLSLTARWDGAGFPKGLAGQQIPLLSRIVTVSNAFIALVSPRPHREPKTVDEALDILFAESQSHYDRNVVLALWNWVRNRATDDELTTILESTDI